MLLLPAIASAEPCGPEAGGGWVCEYSGPPAPPESTGIRPRPDIATAADLTHREVKLYMLRLINEARAAAGSPPVDLGTNSAAQHHADASLAGCLSGHWDVHGLNTVMQCTLAGGYQTVSENVNARTTATPDRIGSSGPACPHVLRPPPGHSCRGAAARTAGGEVHARLWESQASGLPRPLRNPPGLPGPQTGAEARRLWQSANNVASIWPLLVDVYPLITTNTWELTDRHFAISADLSAVIAEHGPGVYAVRLQATLATSEPQSRPWRFSTKGEQVPMFPTDPPELKQYAQRGDPPIDRWPGRTINKEDLMAASGDPR